RIGLLEGMRSQLSPGLLLQSRSTPNMIQVPVRPQCKLQVRGLLSQLGDGFENSILATGQSAVYQHQSFGSFNEVCVSRSCWNPVNTLCNLAHLQQHPFPAVRNQCLLSRIHSEHVLPSFHA